ncbi:hypothetical protein EB061_00055 [bacterium]|jgi:hypothetical protein|nr:hypothetical protein [bacterium]
MDQARDAFLKEDFGGAEAILYSEEVLKDEQGRLQQYLSLASVSFAQGLYEKAVFYLERSRELALELRSDRGFEFSSSEYKSNPIEFSRIHFLLVLSRLLLADSGQTPSWGVPELRLAAGRVLIPMQAFPARVYNPREIEELRTKARADLLAWDSHLVQLRRSFDGSPLYQSDPMARILASFVHGKSPLPRERRTAELLAEQAAREVEELKSEIPSFQREERELSGLISQLAARAKKKATGPDESLFVLDSGVVPKYRARKVVLGLSTLFRGVEDPVLRVQLEQIGLRVLLQFAPEFGLLAFGGAIAGAATASGEDQPVYISDAVDESFGFEMRFPEMVEPEEQLSASLELKGEDGHEWSGAAPVLSPLQEILARETRERGRKEWKEKALKVGLEYLVILIPAVIAYRQAVMDGDWLKKLAILAGFFIAKKGIDRLNAPDLRSWALMPSRVAAACFRLPPGKYQGSWVLQRASGAVRLPVGPFEIPQGGGRLFFQRWNDSSAAEIH